MTTCLPRTAKGGTADNLSFETLVVRDVDRVELLVEKQVAEDAVVRGTLGVLEAERVVKSG